MSSFPKWIYHPTEAAKIVTDAADHAAHAAAGWVESPADLMAASSTDALAAVGQKLKAGAKKVGAGAKGAAVTAATVAVANLGAFQESSE